MTIEQSLHINHHNKRKRKKMPQIIVFKAQDLESHRLDSVCNNISVTNYTSFRGTAFTPTSLDDEGCTVVLTKLLVAEFVISAKNDIALSLG